MNEQINYYVNEWMHCYKMELEKSVASAANHQCLTSTDHRLFSSNLNQNQLMWFGNDHFIDGRDFLKISFRLLAICRLNRIRSFAYWTTIFFIVYTTKTFWILFLKKVTLIWKLVENYIPVSFDYRLYFLWTHGLDFKKKIGIDFICKCVLKRFFFWLYISNGTLVFHFRSNVLTLTPQITIFNWIWR